MRSQRELASLELVKQLVWQKFDTETVIRESSNQFDHYDLLVEYKEIPLYIEVKERFERYCQLDEFIKYSKEGWQMELIKYDFLLGKRNNYVCVFKDVCGETIIMAWDVNKVEKLLTDMTCPKNSEFGGSHIRKIKPSLLLTPKMGTTYLLKDGEFLTVKFERLVEYLKNK